MTARPFRKLESFNAGERVRVRTFQVTLTGSLRFEPHDLRMLLKRLGRDHGLRCTSMVEVTEARETQHGTPAEHPHGGKGDAR